MRRLAAFVLAGILTLGSVGLASVAGAATAGTPCTARSGSGTSTNGMDHDTMKMGSKKSRAAGMNSMGGSCSTVDGAREIAVTGDAFTFSPTEITMASGEDVTIALTADDIAHDFYVKGVGHIVHAKANKIVMGGLRIDEAGTYKFRCTVAGHKKAGMTGTITVT